LHHFDRGMPTYIPIHTRTPIHTTHTHLQMDAPHFIAHTHKSLPFTPHDVKWVPSSARVVCVGAGECVCVCICCMYVCLRVGVG
jgi:hypothetical protein